MNQNSNPTSAPEAEGQFVPSTVGEKLASFIAAAEEHGHGSEFPSALRAGLHHLADEIDQVARKAGGDVESLIADAVAASKAEYDKAIAEVEQVTDLLRETVARYETKLAASATVPVASPDPVADVADAAQQQPADQAPPAAATADKPIDAAAGQAAPSA